MGYPVDFLQTRAVVHHGEYALIPPESREKTTLPFLEGVEVSILASPKLGAHSNFYTICVLPGGRSTRPLQDEGIEVFFYCHAAKQPLSLTISGTTYQLHAREFAFIPAGVAYEFSNDSDSETQVLLYKKRYQPLEGFQAEVVVSGIDQTERVPNSGVDNAFHRDLLPKHMGFDVTFMVLEFEPDGCHGFIETHVEEHCAYILSGQGFYRLGADWLQVKEEDFLWMGPFTPQGTYTTGRKNFSYIYSKEINRDEPL